MTDAPTNQALAAELVEQRKRWLIQAMTIAKAIGLTDEDRHELSIMVVGADRDPSWARFDHGEMGRVVDYLVGFQYISVILRDRVERASINARATHHLSLAKYVTPETDG